MIQPRLLSTGDRVAIVAPAGRIERDGIARAIDILKSWGLEVVAGRNVYGHHGYFSGTDTERLTDLQNAIDDPTVAAVLFARGGYGTTRIIDQVNLESLQSSPKWLIGFSDITALHLKLIKEGMVSIHGDVGTTLGRDAESTAELKNLLFKGVSKLESGEPIRQGAVEGMVTGGNLSLIIDSLGTSTEIDTDGRILFIEEVEEKTYRVDRMMHQLARAGKLENLAGLVAGQFTGIEDGSTKFGATWKECIQRLVSMYSYPVAFGFEFGHEPVNQPILNGASYRLEVLEKSALMQSEIS